MFPAQLAKLIHHFNMYERNTTSAPKQGQGKNLEKTTRSPGRSLPAVPVYQLTEEDVEVETENIMNDGVTSHSNKTFPENAPVQRVLKGKDKSDVTSFFLTKIGKLRQLPTFGGNPGILAKAINNYDNVLDAIRYINMALMVANDLDLDDETLDLKQEDEVIPSDKTMKEKFGFYIVDDKVGNIDDSIKFENTSNRVNNIKKGVDDAFVGSITTTPKAKGGKGPLDVAKQYLEQGFSGDGGTELIS